jgi:hypothetical protein
MFTATGTDKAGNRFDLVWQPGRVTGTENILAALLARVGQTVKETPTGPTIPYDLDDPASVAAAVREAASADVEFFGEVPPVTGLPPDSEG